MPEQTTIYSPTPDPALVEMGRTGGATGLLLKTVAPYNIINGAPIPTYKDKEFADFILDNYVMGTFGGIGAKTADLGALKIAKQMEKAGASAEEIMSKTNWFRPTAGEKWRYRIDDSGMRFKEPILYDQRRGAPYQGPLRDVIEHDELLKAYPELSELFIKESWYAQPLERGSFEQTVYDVSGQKLKDPAIHLNMAAFSNPHSVLYRPREWTLGHELQHAIQEIEGFSLGGTPNSNFWIQPVFPDPKHVRKIENDLFEEIGKERGLFDHPWHSRPELVEYARMRGYKRPTEKLRKEYMEVFQLKDFSEKRDSVRDATRHALYRKLLGEAEANAVISELVAPTKGLPAYASDPTLIRRK